MNLHPLSRPVKILIRLCKYARWFESLLVAHVGIMFSDAAALSINVVFFSDGLRLPAPPLDTKRLEEARSVRKKEVMMRSAFMNVVINLFICWILFSISYSNRDNRSFYLHQDVVKQILKPIGLPSFVDVSSKICLAMQKHTLQGSLLSKWFLYPAEKGSSLKGKYWGRSILFF